MSASITFLEEDLRKPLAAAGLSTYDDFMACDRGEAVTQSGSSQTQRITVRVGGSEDTLYLKRYRYGAGRWRFRMDKAACEARNYSYLRHSCEIAVPEVVCLGCRSRLLWRRDGFLLTRSISGSVSLDVLAARHWPTAADGASSPERRALLETACEMIRRMHARHFYHLDLQWRNILVQDMRRLFVIDSWRGGPRWGPVFRAHGRLRDLSSLAKEAMVRLSRTERLRWLRRYFGARRLSKEHRMVIRAIERDRFLKDNSRR